ncbi:MAG: TraB/GumN family protein [Spirochaetes bacterium]|jgi:pheromone shutdown-related protein TraB|nr:TraB/GumN family protein [Spirochaetota bacterium]
MNNPKISEIEQNVHHIVFDNDKELYLVGTAHVSQFSVQLVENVITDYDPDTIAIELDKKRYNSITEKTRYENIDIIQMIKKRELFFFIGQFILSMYQKRISEKTGTQPGQEFIKAIELSKEGDKKLVLADRELGTTLKRAWRLTPFKHKIKLFFALLFSSEEKVEEKDIEDLKKTNALDEMIKTFAVYLPNAKQVLIDERDAFLSYEIMNNLGDKTVAIVGAGHVPGILKTLTSPVTKRTRTEIDIIPAGGRFSKITPWIIPAIIIIVFILGFIFGKRDIALDFAIFWVLANGILTAIGCALALAHPLTIIAGFIAAPITSLNPTIGAGFVTALVQTLLVKPRVKDFEQIQDGTLTIGKWWKNRLTKIFLVFILSSIGSSVGTFVAAPYLFKFFHG